MENQYLIMVVGHNASGKTYISEKIADKFKLNRINNDLIRKFVIENIKYYNDAIFSYPGGKINSVNKVVWKFSINLIIELLKNKQSVLVDGISIVKSKRTKYFKLANKKITTIIIETKIDEDELLRRLQTRDQEDKKDKWVKFYKDIRKNKYDPIKDNEADYVFHYNQKNLNEIIKQLKKMIK